MMGSYICNLAHLHMQYASNSKFQGSHRLSVEPNTVDRDLNQYKIAVLLFGAANAAPNKCTTISHSFSSTNFSIISV